MNFALSQFPPQILYPFFTMHREQPILKGEKHFLARTAMGIVAASLLQYDFHFWNSLQSLCCWLQCFPSIWTTFSMSSSERNRFSAWALWVNDVPTWALASHQLKAAHSLLCYSPKHIAGDLASVLKQTKMNECSLFFTSGFDIPLIHLFALPRLLCSWTRSALELCMSLMFSDHLTSDFSA